MHMPRSWILSSLVVPLTAAAATVGHDIVAEARPLAVELTRPKYALSRCLLPPVLAVDGRSIIKGEAPWVAGDVVVAVNGAALDAGSRTALIEVLEHLAPDADVTLRIQRGREVQTVTAHCADAKPYYDELRAGAQAAAADDGAACARHLGQAALLHGLSATWARLDLSCRIDGGQLSGSAMWRADYELYRQLIDEAGPVPPQLAALRHPVLGAARELEANGQARLGAELRQHYAAAAAALPATDD